MRWCLSCNGYTLANHTTVRSIFNPRDRTADTSRHCPADSAPRILPGCRQKDPCERPRAVGQGRNLRVDEECGRKLEKAYIPAFSIRFVFPVGAAFQGSSGHGCFG